MVHENHSALCVVNDVDEEFCDRRVVIDTSKSLSQIEVEVSISTVIASVHVNNLHQSIKKVDPLRQQLLLSLVCMFISATKVQIHWILYVDNSNPFRFRISFYDSCKKVVLIRAICLNPWDTCELDT
jgi:hypothetical protein